MSTPDATHTHARTHTHFHPRVRARSTATGVSPRLSTGTAAGSARRNLWLRSTSRPCWNTGRTRTLSITRCVELQSRSSALWFALVRVVGVWALHNTLPAGYAWHLRCDGALLLELQLPRNRHLRQRMRSLLCLWVFCSNQTDALGHPCSRSCTRTQDGRICLSRTLTLTFLAHSHAHTYRSD